MSTVKIDEEVMTEAEFERKLLNTHWAGQAASLESAAKSAKVKAGDFYAAKRDDTAKIWREVGDWLEEMGKAARKKQKEFTDGPTNPKLG